MHVSMGTSDAILIGLLALVILFMWVAGGLGLRDSLTRRIVQPRRPRRAYLCITPFLTFEDYVSGLRRSPRVNLTTHVARAMMKVTVTTRAATPLVWKHFSVILAHEQRMHRKPRALFAAIMRFVVASLMVAVLDEYWGPDGKLLAFTHTVVCGNVLRVAWFYQCTRQHLWHHAIRQAVERSIRLPGIEWVDLGPSASEALAHAKLCFGFVDKVDWSQCCSYSGPFCHAQLVQ